MISNILYSLIYTNKQGAKEDAKKIGAKVVEYHYCEPHDKMMINPRFLGWVLMKNGEVIE